MKLLPLILASILLLPGLRPCMGSFVCADSLASDSHECRSEESEHSCCQLPGEKERTPTKEDPCNEGCYCYCCVLIVATAPSDLPSHPPLETNIQKPWKASAYFHEFTHLIWQPPQVC